MKENILIALLIINIRHSSPPLPLLPQNLINRLLPPILRIVIHATKVIPMVLHIAVLVATAGKVKAHPGLDLVLVRLELVAVVLLDFGCPAGFFVVGGELVVQDRVPVEADVVGFGGCEEGFEFGAGAPFGGC